MAAILKDFTVSKYSAFFLMVLLCASLGFGQEFWQKVAPRDHKIQIKNDGEKGVFYKQLLVPQSLSKSNPSSFSEALVMKFPNERGEEESFQLHSISVLSPELQKKYPQLRTFVGKSMQRPELRVRVSITPQGTNFWLQLPHQEDFFLQPSTKQKGLHYAYTQKSSDANSFQCKTSSNAFSVKNGVGATQKTAVSSAMRTFRIALAATAEYTNFWGDDDDSNGTNQEDAFAALVSSINRVNEIFGRDVNVQLEIVSDLDLFYEDADTDPFTGGNYAKQLQQILDEKIGDEGYDVGHLVDYGEADGDAGCIGCVCVDGLKGSGYTTHPFVDEFGGEYKNDYFDLDYLGHELGHQFGAYHTYSFESEATGFNVEPGSGTTIMSYAGLVGEDNVQLHGDAYFHYQSIQNIASVLDGVNCGTSVTFESSTPNVDAGQDYKIPKGTAYMLQATTSVENADALNYTWEQLDAGIITSSNFGASNTRGALARSLPPTENTWRSIPNIDQVLAGELTQTNPDITSTWETVSEIGRSLKWGVTLRQRVGDEYQIAQDATQLVVVANAGPFKINTQDSATTLWEGGSRQVIGWDVANTDRGTIGTTSVDILLSLDGGQNFTISLATATANDGLEEIVVPNGIDTSSARIKIEPTNSIYYAVNATPFTISSRSFALFFEAFELEACNENRLVYNFTIDRATGFNSNISLAVSDLPTGVTAVFSKNTYAATDASGTVTFSGLKGKDPGELVFNIQARSGSQSYPFAVDAQIRNLEFEAPTLNSLADGAQEVDLSNNFSWETDSNANAYILQFSKIADFSQIDREYNLTEASYQVDDLLSGTEYYWRVKSKNACSESSFSETRSFKTIVVECVTFEQEELPLPIKDANEVSIGVTTASIMVNYDAVIKDVNVLLSIDHTYLEDLTLYLVAPDERTFLLVDQLGGEEDDFSQTIFDAEAQTSVLNGTPPFTGTYTPIDDLSELYGTSAAGVWSLKILDQFQEDVGRLIDFRLEFCLLGAVLPNSDDDTLIDLVDNCPYITNPDQLDSNNNGIGDLCDLYAPENISISRKEISCPDKSNGEIQLTATAAYNYSVLITADNGYSRNYDFTTTGRTISNLAAGSYRLCVTTRDVPGYERCFETEIAAPERLWVNASVLAQTQQLQLEFAGGAVYYVQINDTQFTLPGTTSNAQFFLKKGLNKFSVSTGESCQGTYEEWINLEDTAKYYPNPVSEVAHIVLPQQHPLSIRMYNSSGGLLWETTQIPTAAQALPLSMSAYTAGVYIVKLDYGTHVESFKLLKR